MDMSKRVFVAMSGGVDSSVTAYLLKEAGYEVIGIHLELTSSQEPVTGEHGELESTCRKLGIPIHFLQVQAEFENSVVNHFCTEYNLGRTPNPCVQCNKNIKFGLLLDWVQAMGGDYLATGHYARIAPSTDGYRLLKGLDSGKDQSYFLYTLGQKELAKVLFPLGGLFKNEVKKMALNLGLPAANSRESQDICFIPNGDYRLLLSSRLKQQPGEIVDTNGNIRGQHKGLANYTIGQRQGIGISAGQPLYVISLDAVNNRLIIGTREFLLKRSLIACQLNWISGRPPGKEFDVFARVRYRSSEVKAHLSMQNCMFLLTFAEPQRAITPGQSVVFYQGEQVLGGGIIASTS